MRDYKGIRPAVGIPKERAISYADEVYPWIVATAQQWPIINLSYGRTDWARNEFVEHIMKDGNFTHLVMLDIDHAHPFDIVGQLCESVSEDPISRQALSALAFRRNQPYDPIAWKWDKKKKAFYTITTWEPGEVLEVDQFSGAANIIAREVFERLPWPWFKYEYPERGAYPGEELWFCKQARKAGIKLHVDTRIETPHLSVSKIDERVFRHYVAEFQRHQEVRNGTGNQGA